MIIDIAGRNMRVTFDNPNGTITELDLPPIIGIYPLEEVSPDYLDGWRKLLAEPHLVDQSIAIETSVGIFLAVPVGGVRRSGCFDFGCKDPQAVIDILKGKPGFPNLRINAPFAEWGEDPPDTNWEDNGKWYGYCSEEIVKFCSDGPYESPLKHCMPFYRKSRKAIRLDLAAGESKYE